MQKEALSLLNASIYSLNETTKVGTIKNIFIDPNNGQILFFLVETGLLFKKQKCLSAENIIDIKGGEVIISDSFLIDELKDSPDFLELKKAKIKIFGCLVVTENGEKIGRASNFSFVFPGFFLSKIYVRKNVFKDFLTSELIIPAEKILEINRKNIIVEDLNQTNKELLAEIS